MHARAHTHTRTHTHTHRGINSFKDWALSQMNYMKPFIGIKWLIIAQKVNFFREICICVGIKALGKKNKNSRKALWCVIGRERAVCPLTVSEITPSDFSCPPDLQTYAADFYGKLAFSLLSG